MVLNTRHFGEISIDEEKVITFENGLPGFPDCRRFILLQAESSLAEAENCMFWWLQCVDWPETAFVMVDVIMLMPDYNPLIEEDEMAGLGEYDPDTFLVYNIANIPDDIKRMTVNLKAPVIINTNLRKGKQIIATNEEYSVRYSLFDFLEQQAGNF
ncbi:MAG: flagellar assembly protein FliW [Clostridiales bacterium]|jgi:flagellar assembly factor FliW|nr:flagellar assembly protein FliW [Clostridiales bacterium]